jgi:hypothetical protein
MDVYVYGELAPFVIEPVENVERCTAKSDPTFALTDNEP